MMGGGFGEMGLVSSYLSLTPASHHLLGHARRLISEKQYQFAVVFAHAACELHTESELIRLVNARTNEVLAGLILPGERDVKSLANSRIYRVYSALTGDEPKKAEWWERWKHSRDDRHSVAHKGAEMSQEQAEGAVDVADRYIRHMTEKVESALRNDRA